MTAVDKQAEKDRLIHQIKQFRNDTESGITLTLLTSEGHYVSCKLFVDRVMGRIVIRRDADSVHDSCIVDVQGVYNHFQAFSIWLPHMKGYNAYQSIGRRDRNSAVIITHCNEENPNSIHNICLLAPNAATRDHFISMLKILVDWYKRHPGRMDKEKWRAEKERVYSMLKSFSRKAVVGLPCKLLERSTGTCVTANFSLDRALRIVTVEYCSKKIIVSLADVEGVYPYYHDLMDELPDAEISQDVIKTNHNKAVFVHHGAQDLPELWICLLLQDEAEVERFVTCLRILKMHIEFEGTSLSQEVVYTL
eukprot:gnl/MRDRNA2_/MRDRNA2_95008_c0_seq1.p1 gnl/MRDRNA2_/MRDRNA2_95008_c0~~gnl/MRDRNA2_/MRDRNA2_95008_c0_seq1.p1  ORF type:complete len:339 (-),score=42.85 gnl/MRDRNA2_/MRDRNA2_95008_c0_seq1:161-1081(-)